MNWAGISVSAAVSVALWSGLAFGQAKLDCTPHKVEGRITNIDTAQGRLTLQEANGQTIEFQAPADTLKDKKVGDRLEISKRLPEGCK